MLVTKNVGRVIILLEYFNVMWCIFTAKCLNNISKTKQQFLYLTREGFLRKNIVAVSFFQNCAIHQYS